MKRLLALALAMESTLTPADALSAPPRQAASPPQLVPSASAVSISEATTTTSETSSTVGDVFLDGPEDESFHDDVEASIRAVEVEEPDEITARLPDMVRLAGRQAVVAKTAVAVSLLYAAMRRILPTHLELLENLLAGTVIFMIGDWAAQLLTHYKVRLSLDTFRMDSKRFVISTLLGCLWRVRVRVRVRVGGYVNPTIYATVEGFLPGKTIKLVLLKMVVTCSILSTWGNYTTMMIRRFFKQIWEGPHERGLIRRSFRRSVRGCNQDFREVLRDDLKVWPLYDIACYSLIPPHVRPVTNALMASAWATYMSIASAKALPAESRGKNIH